MKLILAAANAERRRNTRRVSQDDVEFLVVPLVAIVAGELNGEIVSAKEIAKSLPAWDGVPVTFRHPKVNDVYVSVKAAPQYSIGTFRTPRLVENAMRGEAWLPVGVEARTDRLIEAFENGAEFDVSTGYFANVDENRNQFDIRPDHLAVLVDEKGACSWADGCGIPRTHQQKTSKRESEGKESMDEQNSTADEVEEIEEVASEEAPESELDIEAVEDEPEVDPEPVANQDDALAEAVASLNARVAELEGKFNAQEDERRAKLVTEIKANSQNFTDDDLSSMSTDLLAKIATTVRPAGYAVGRPAPVTNSETLEDYVVPTLD